MPDLGNIVIAEDSLTQAEMLAHILNQAGYSAKIGFNGEEALALIHQDMPDMVISDVLMPRMNGYELCKHIKSQSSLRHIPVLLLTTLTEPEDILIGLECGADNYLMKPFDDAVLLNKVSSLMSSESPDDPLAEYELSYEGKKFNLHTSRRKILDMMTTTYEVARRKNLKLIETKTELNSLKNSLEKKVEERTSDLRKVLEDRRTIEEFIRQSEQRNRNLLENALLGMVVLDHTGRINYYNSTFFEMTGLRHKKDLKGEQIQRLLHSGPDWGTLLSELSTDRNAWNKLIWIESHREGKRWVLLNARRVQEEYTLTMLDITARVQLEEKEKANQKELTQAKELSEQSERQKTLFLNNMSHEIKTPLNAITGFSGMAVDPDIDPEKRMEYLRHVKNNSHELSVILSKILRLARLEASKITHQHGPCEISELFEEVGKESSKALGILESDPVSISWNAAPSDHNATVHIDAGRLKQVLLYLIENAWNHTRTGKIRFGGEIRDHELFVYVKDSGTGIPPDYLPYVFERFSKNALPGARTSRGMGLGLTISEHLIRMMKGRIWIESTLGKGTSVFITIPVKAVEPAPRTTPTHTEPSLNSILKGKKILVAEDNQINYLLIKAYLIRYDIDITWAQNGKEAVDCIRSSKDIDGILMDVQMPVMDGCTAAMEIRKMDQEIPIIAVTAFHQLDENMGQCKNAFNEILTKPVTEQELAGTLVKYLDVMPELK